MEEINLVNTPTSDQDMAVNHPATQDPIERAEGSVLESPPVQTRKGPHPMQLDPVQGREGLPLLHLFSAAYPARTHRQPTKTRKRSTKHAPPLPEPPTQSKKAAKGSIRRYLTTDSPPPPPPTAATMEAPAFLTLVHSQQHKVLRPDFHPRRLYLLDDKGLEICQILDHDREPGPEDYLPTPHSPLDRKSVV